MSEVDQDKAGETAPDTELQQLEQQLAGKGLVKSLDPVASEPVEKPVEKPAEATQPPAPEEEAEVEVEDDAPKGNKAFAAMRTALKEAQAQIDELKRSRAEPPPAPTETKATVPADKLFMQLNDALTGPAEDAASATQTAREAIEKLPVSDIRKIVERAQRGEFGDKSANILALAKDELTPALARDLEARDAQQQEQQKSAEWQSKNAASLASVVEKNPDLNKPDSDLFKFLGKFREEHIAKLDKDGKVVEQGPLYPLMSDPLWPEKVIPLAVKMFNATQAEAKAKEADTLKKKLADKVTPTGGDGHAVAVGATSELDQLENDLKALGTVGRRH